MIFLVTAEDFLRYEKFFLVTAEDFLRYLQFCPYLTAENNLRWVDHYSLGGGFDKKTIRPDNGRANG